ncbi:hypothetical protein D3C80_2008610 [compost metagenome]
MAFHVVALHFLRKYAGEGRVGKGERYRSRGNDRGFGHEVSFRALKFVIDDMTKTIRLGEEASAVQGLKR